MKRMGLIFLACLFVGGCAYGILKKSDKEVTFAYVKENEEALEVLAQAVLQGQKTTRYEAFEVRYYPQAETVEFMVSGNGFGSGTTYQGFYDTVEPKVLGFQGVELAFQPDGNGWKWEEGEGDNWAYIEEIVKGWYWFRAGF